MRSDPPRPSRRVALATLAGAAVVPLASGPAPAAATTDPIVTALDAYRSATVTFDRFSEGFSDIRDAGPVVFLGTIDGERVQARSHDEVDAIFDQQVRLCRQRPNSDPILIEVARRQAHADLDADIREGKAVQPQLEEARHRHAALRAACEQSLEDLIATHPTTIAGAAAFAAFAIECVLPWQEKQDVPILTAAARALRAVAV